MVNLFMATPPTLQSGVFLFEHVGQMLGFIAGWKLREINRIPG